MGKQTKKTMIQLKAETLELPSGNPKKMECCGNCSFMENASCLKGHSITKFSDKCWKFIKK